MLPMLCFMAAFFLSPQQEWAWRIYPESGFKILAPYELTDRITQVPTDVDVIEYHQYSGGSVNDSILKMAFVIDHYLMPGELTGADETEVRDFFENTIDPVLNAVEGSLLYMDIQRYPAKEVCTWKAAYRNGEGVIRGECMLTGRKYYGLQVFGWAQQKPEALMNKFFDSFQLLPSPPK